jgi:hypothetical protein
VHGVAQLQSRNFLPPALFENLAGLGRPHVDAGVFLRILALAQDLHGAGQVDGLLIHDHLNARVVLFGDLPELFGRLGAFAHEDFFALVLFLGRAHVILLGDLHGGHDFLALGVVQGDFFPDIDFGRVLLGS